MNKITIRIFLLLGIFVPLLLAGTSSSISKWNKKAVDHFKLRAMSLSGDVSLGRGPNCDQRGICTYDDASSSRSSGAGGTVFAIDADNHLMLIIDRSVISREELREQVVDGKFEVQKNGFTVPLSVMQQLGQNEERLIPAGFYPTLITEESVIIRFVNN